MAIFLSFSSFKVDSLKIRALPNIPRVHLTCMSGMVEVKLTAVGVVGELAGVCAAIVNIRSV